MSRAKTVKKRPAKKRRANGAAAAAAEKSAPALEPRAEDLDKKKENATDIDSLRKIFDEAKKFEADASSGLRYVDVQCPYCGEDFEITVDPGEQGQEMIQDCRACCKPITFFVEENDGEVTVDAYGS